MGGCVSHPTCTWGSYPWGKAARAHFYISTATFPVLHLASWRAHWKHYQLRQKQMKYSNHVFWHLILRRFTDLKRKLVQRFSHSHFHWLTLMTLTLNLLTWRIWWACNNASRWQMGFNSAFRGLTHTLCNTGLVMSNLALLHKLRRHTIANMCRARAYARMYVEKYSDTSANEWPW